MAADVKARAQSPYKLSPNVDNPKARGGTKIWTKIDKSLWYEGGNDPLHYSFEWDSKHIYSRFPLYSVRSNADQGKIVCYIGISPVSFKCKYWGCTELLHGNTMRERWILYCSDQSELSRPHVQSRKKFISVLQRPFCEATFDSFKHKASLILTAVESLINTLQNLFQINNVNINMC